MGFTPPSWSSHKGLWVVKLRIEKLLGQVQGVLQIGYQEPGSTPDLRLSREGGAKRWTMRVLNKITIDIYDHQMWEFFLETTSQMIEFIICMLFPLKIAVFLWEITSSYYLYNWQSLKYLLWHPVYVANGLTNHWLKLDKWPLGLKLDVSRSFRATVRYDWPLLCWQKINLKFGVWQCFSQGCNWDPRYPLCYLTKNAKANVDEKICEFQCINIFLKLAAQHLILLWFYQERRSFPWPLVLYSSLMRIAKARE